MLMCSDPTPTCYLDECKNCPKVNGLSSKLKKLLRNAIIESLEFKTWKFVDRTTSQMQKLPVSEFVDLLCERLKALKPHHSIATEQTAYVKGRKENLVEGEILVQCDFSDNYSFVAQDAAQSFHYNNEQCTVHPAVYYYRQGSDIRHRSLVLLSDSFVHDTVRDPVFGRVRMSRQSIMYKLVFLPSNIVWGGLKVIYESFVMQWH